MKRIASAFIAAAVLLCVCSGCAGSVASGRRVLQSEVSSVPVQSQPPLPEPEIETVLDMLQGARPQRLIDEAFLRWGNENVDAAFALKLQQALQTQGYDDGIFYALFGKTLLVLHDEYSGAAQAEGNIHFAKKQAGPIVLAFTGDVNLADTWENMLVLHQQPNGISDCIAPELMEQMRAADVLFVNNEFAFSDRGKALHGKDYTFRAKTENVAILKEMGVDIVSLANNHVFDFGEDAFYDTLDTLAAAEIPYVGAGRELEEAMRPQYFVAGGMKIGYVAACRAEKWNVFTPGASSTQPGVLLTYDETDFLQAVETAKQNADMVIAYPHWGTENTTKLEDVQVTLGQKLIDAGADAVIGAHPHCLQGIDFYNGKPVAYSLGNYWFNTDTVDTALLELHVRAPGNFDVVVQPCLQSGGRARLLEQEGERQRIFGKLEKISAGIEILEDGTVVPAE